MNLLVTGAAGVGKSAVMADLSRLLEDRGIPHVGILGEEILRDNRSVGYKLRPIGHGEARIVAHESLISQHRVGRLGVDVENIAYVSDMVLRAPSADIVLIDQIGAMESLSQRFVVAVTELLDGRWRVVAAIPERGGGFLREVASRGDREVVRVTAENRQRVPHELLERLTVESS